MQISGRQHTNPQVNTLGRHRLTKDVLSRESDVVDQLKAGVTGIANVIVEGLKQLLTSAAEAQKEQGLTNSEAIKFAFKEIVKPKQSKESDTDDTDT